MNLREMKKRISSHHKSRGDLGYIMAMRVHNKSIIGIYLFITQTHGDIERIPVSTMAMATRTTRTLVAQNVPPARQCMSQKSPSSSFMAGTSLDTSIRRVPRVAPMNARRAVTVTAKKAAGKQIQVCI